MSPHRRYNGPTNRDRRPWYDKLLERLKFERGVSEQNVGLRGIKAKRGYEYRLSLPIPEYDTRAVTIRFEGHSDKPAVFSDGPGDSPHRYADKSLCMWYPSDPVDRKWVFGDGLYMLISIITTHLFREAWWRETGEWVGEEVPHGSDSKDAAQT